MVFPFFAIAAQSPRRQFAFRATVAFHLLMLLGCFWLVRAHPQRTLPLLGLVMLIAGIVEGGILISWRLTQLPKSRALEFLLTSPLRPPLVFLSEFLVGCARLLLLTLAGFPFYLLLVADGFLDIRDLVPLLMMPFTWGLLTGLGLASWAYEPMWLRKLAGKFMFGLLLVYLVIGFVAGENLKYWVEDLPRQAKDSILYFYYFFNTFNPFAVIFYSLDHSPEESWQRVWYGEFAALGIILVMVVRAPFRLQAHFHERHYSPIQDSKKKRKRVGNLPLVWWAVRRVSEYSGKVNLWLATAFGILYAFHLLAGDYWPAWMGRQALYLFDSFFGVVGVATGLVVLSAVPAAFQYGLWDSSAQDRCRRLELLLLTELNSRDYWLAAMAAAWKRGRGYMFIAILLWFSAALGGHISFTQVSLALLASLILWLLYFTLGFRSFSTGMQANNLGLLLTAILPIVTWGLFRSQLPFLGALTPPGMVYAAGQLDNPVYCLPGILGAGLLTLYVERQALRQCIDELRKWYEQFHGQKVVD